jgi:hypothetical protein
VIKLRGRWNGALSKCRMAAIARVSGFVNGEIKHSDPLIHLFMSGYAVFSGYATVGVLSC